MGMQVGTLASMCSINPAHAFEFFGRDVLRRQRGDLQTRWLRAANQLAGLVLKQRRADIKRLGAARVDMTDADVDVAARD